MLKVTNSEIDTLLLDVMSRGNCLRIKAQGWSMYPFIQNDDSLLIQRKRINDLNIGDVVLFRYYEGNYITHRLIKKNGLASLLTKGDNVRRFDEPVAMEHVLGRLIQIERDGRRIKLTGGLSQILGWLIAWFGGHYPTQTRLTRNLGRLLWLIEGRLIG